MANSVSRVTSRRPLAVILDQDAVGSQQLKEVLAERGFTVLTAADQEAVLRLCRDHAPVELLFTNLTLPGQDALDLIHSVKRQWPSLKVIAVTDYAAGVIRRAGDVCDAIPVLRKPLDAHTIGNAVGSPLWPRRSRAVRSWLSRSHLRLVK